MYSKTFIAFLILFSFFINSCRKDSATSGTPVIPPVVQPIGTVITTTVANSVTINSAICTGEITNDGGFPITERGICYSIAANPTTTDNKVSSGIGTGNFWASLTGLIPATTYYFRAFATNSQGTTYSTQLTFRTLRIYTLGEVYGGGIIFYIDSTGQHGLIVPTNGQASTNWSCSIFLNNANATAIGTGRFNTSSIISQCSYDYTAAGVCYYLNFNGYDDWFLPSKDELNEMFVNKDLIGGWGASTNDDYWSSSQISSPYAWKQNFTTGSAALESKGSFHKVRAVRSF